MNELIAVSNPPPPPPRCFSLDCSLASGRQTDRQTDRPTDTTAVRPSASSHSRPLCSCRLESLVPWSSPVLYTSLTRFRKSFSDTCVDFPRIVCMYTVYGCSVRSKQFVGRIARTPCLDAPYCYAWRSLHLCLSVCLCIGHTAESCKNG